MRFYLFIYFFLPDNVIVTLLQYFVWCITHSFRLWRKTFDTAL